MSDVIYGRRAVLDALESGVTIHGIILAAGVRPGEVIDRIRDLANRAGISVKIEERQRLDRLSEGGVHQGVVALAPEYEYESIQDVLSADPLRLILLDGVTDPHNLGSILRSADAFGWTGVLIPKRRAVGVTPSVRKVAAGAAERVPVARIGSAAEMVRRLQRENVLVVAVDPAADDDYRTIDFTERICLVLGAEGEGIKRLVRDRCDHVVRIPMTGAMASLNVAVAAAVVMVEVTHSRGLDTT